MQLFNLQAFPSEKPCGTSNLTLNGVPLLQEWESAGIHAQGLASVNSSGHELNLFLRSDCLYGSEGISGPSATQLLTFTIEKVNSQIIKSISGFSLSFKQAPTPELLRLSVVPDFEARDQPYSEAWRNPPANLRLIPVSEDQEGFETQRQLTIADHIEDLNRLEAQATLLQKLIEEKKEFIKAEFKEGAHALKEEIKQCESLVCIIKAIGRKVRAAAHVVYLKFHTNRHLHHNFTTEFSIAGIQAPTTMTVSTDTPQAPDAVHCTDGKPSCKPNIQLCRNCRNETALDEKAGPGLTVASVHPLSEEQAWRDAQPPSSFAIFLKTILLITGIACLIAFFKRQCMSLRRQAERAADRERRKAECLYKCQSRKQAWKDWWHGRRRGNPGRRTGDYDEKRVLIIQQEGVLEGAMQDEIRQLQIQEEIRQLRHTRDQVDDLIRAEEGRNTYLSSSGTARQHPQPFSHVPTPITIPNMASIMYPPQHDRSSAHNAYNTPNSRIHDPFAHPEDDSDSEPPMSPVSRTSSLPDYKTEASNQSEPPAYDDQDDMVNDGFSDYSPSSTMSSHDGEDGWSPGSSIPDISPRPSIETTRTFL